VMVLLLFLAFGIGVPIMLLRLFLGQ